MLEIILALENLSEPAMAPDINIHEWIVPAYGSEISFDIKRKGKQIGTHEVTFENIDNRIYVEVITKIRVKFLFFNAFKFDYSSREVWQNNNLIFVYSSTNDNGEKSEVVKEFGENAAEVLAGDRQFSSSLEGVNFTSNHWNPNVLNASTLLNTITGKINQVNISNQGWEVVPGQDGERNAIRHNYNGQLNNISAWYDEKWRWVGLSFKGKDGSVISYECKQCGA